MVTEEKEKKPVLIDITNVISSISSKPTITGHEELREAAWWDLENYTNKMVNQMKKGRKMSNNYKIGDLVRIAVPKINRFSIDWLMLSCKILEKVKNRYQLESKFGIIDIFYSSEELKPLRVEQFPELDIIPINKITIREASRLQNVELTKNTICNCKGTCNSKKCNCRKNGNNCESQCYNGH